MVGLEQSASRMAVAAKREDVDTFVEADIEFHHTLMIGSGNAVMVQLLRTIDATLRSRYGGGMPVFSDATAPSIGRHLDLAAAINLNDPTKAGEEALALIQEARAEAFVGGVL